MIASSSKIGIIGTRGIPANYGGFETFAQEISVRLVEKGFDVTVYCDKSSNKITLPSFYQGVKLRYQRTTKTKNSILFYLDGLIMALKENDIIIVTGSGGSMFYFLNIVARKIIITNTDGIESRRDKWSFIQKKVIKLMETLAIKFSNHIISDSKAISQYIFTNYPKINSKKVSTIEYGAVINDVCINSFLEKHNLIKNEFYLVVSRLEPENNVHLIIEGFKLAQTEKPLIIVGNILNNEYVNLLLSHQSENIRFIGGIYNNKELCSMRTAAFAYVHGHSVGGTNPSLLEAMGSLNICICHDNVFNREVTDNDQRYFSEPKDFIIIINELENSSYESLELLKNKSMNKIKNYYNWENISNKYTSLISSL
jgi:glycosyltransferase involved in cell wall biosynthesis